MSYKTIVFEKENLVSIGFGMIGLIQCLTEYDQFIKNLIASVVISKLFIWDQKSLD